jgi:hypothetical protein
MEGAGLAAAQLEGTEPVVDREIHVERFVLVHQLMA